MKIVLVTANWPPTPCGVGDHSLRTATAWAKQKHDVSILTSQSDQNHVPVNNVDVMATVSGWGLRQWWSIRRQLKQLEADAIVVQWVPQLYSPRGLALGLPLAIFTLPPQTGRKVVYLHELWPTGWSPKIIFLQLIQRFAAFLLCARADRIYTTVASWQALLQSHLPWQRERVEHLTAGSNFWSAARGPKEIDAKRVIVVSPGAAGMLEKFLVKAWQKLREAEPDAELVCIGGRHEPGSQWQKLGQDPRVKFTGYLEGEAMRRQIRSGALAWAPFKDGLTARRGSAMASLAMGVPLIASTGNNADYRFFKNSGVEFCDADVKSWVATTQRLMNDPEKLRQQRQEAWDFARLQLDPSELAQALLK